MDSWFLTTAWHLSMFWARWMQSIHTSVQIPCNAVPYMLRSWSHSLLLWFSTKTLCVCFDARFERRMIWKWESVKHFLNSICFLNSLWRQFLFAIVLHFATFSEDFLVGFVFEFCLAFRWINMKLDLVVRGWVFRKFRVGAPSVE